MSMTAERWTVTQQLVDPADDGEWRFVATVDLATSMAEGGPTLVLRELGPYEPADVSLDNEPDEPIDDESDESDDGPR